MSLPCPSSSTSGASAGMSYEWSASTTTTPYPADSPSQATDAMISSHGTHPLSHITVTFAYGRWLGPGLGYHPKDCAKAQPVISISGSEDKP